MADAYLREGREIGSEPKIWYVTASLNLSYLAPTPLAETLELKAKILKIENRKTWVTCSVFANNVECVKAEVLAIQIQRKI